LRSIIANAALFAFVRISDCGPLFARATLVGLLFLIWQAAEDLQDHSEIAIRAEVCDLDAFEFAAEGNINSSFGLLCQQLVEALGFDGDVVHATTFFGKEARDDALIPERLDLLSLHLPDHGDCRAE
jgi:hypothetical protein